MTIRKCTRNGSIQIFILNFVGASPGTSTDELTLVPSTTKSGKNAKQVPSLEHGFLVQVRIIVYTSYFNVNDFCALNFTDNVQF